jgi:26S proteasome non-ATPase regulatory subunit 10
MWRVNLLSLGGGGTSDFTALHSVPALLTCVSSAWRSTGPNTRYTRPVAEARVRSLPRSLCHHADAPPAAKVESLLAANPKLAAQRDPDDRLALHWAVSYNHVPIVQLLSQLKGFDADVKDGSGWTPLMMACSRKDAEAIVDLLLSMDADVNAINNNGQTALHFCASKSNLDIARTLLSQKPPASARKKDKRSQLPLHRAAAVGNVPMLKALLDANSPLNATDMDGMTALHHAMSEGHGDAALLLLTRGAEFDKKDNHEQVPLDLAPDAKMRHFIVQAAEREGIDLE